MAENGGVHGQCTRPCIRPAVYTAENGRAHGPYTIVYTCVCTARTRPCKTAVYTYTCVHHCTQPCISRVHVPCTRANMARTWPCTRTCRVRAICTDENVYAAVSRNTAVYTFSAVHDDTRPSTRPCVTRTRPRTRPCMRPLYSRVRAIYTAENVYTAVFTHVTRPFTRPVYTFSAV